MPGLELIDGRSVSGFHSMRAFVSVLQKSITLCLRAFVPRSSIQQGQLHQRKCHSAFRDWGLSIFHPWLWPGKAAAHFRMTLP